MGRRAIVLLVALILAGLAGWAVWNYMTTLEEDIKADLIVTPVFRAGQAIQEGADGSVLFSDFNSGGPLVVESEDQVGDVPADAIGTVEQLNQVLTGKVAAGPISANSILTTSQWVTLTVTDTPIRDEIPSGKQAMTISLDNVTGVNGFVEAGDHVNLIITLDIAFDLIPEEFEGPIIDPPDTGGEEGDGETETRVVTYTRFVMQDLPVIATGRDVRPDEEAPPTVDVEGPEVPAEGEDPAAAANATVFTVEVTPEQAERLAFAFGTGSIWMTLVPEDFVPVETQGVILDTLFGGDLVEDIFG